jgi:acetyl-CoA carboxylase biotin carboxyl carrier protein
MPKQHKDRTTKLVSDLIEILEEEDLAELSFSDGDFSVTIKAPNPEPQVVVAASAPYAAPQAPEKPAAEPRPSHLVEIGSPMTGVFFRSPAPGEPAFVEVGDSIEVGQTIGLVEAMKVFSEIPSEVAGQIVEIEAENAELVHEGGTLMVVDPTASGA